MNQVYLDRMKDILGNRYNDYLESLEKTPFRSIRLNKIKYEDFVKNINMPLEKISYDKDGYYLNNLEKYGNHPYHHLGAFYFQEPSAMMPINLYDFKGDELVLDLCASPGGKSSQVARNLTSGVLVSNEIDSKRCNVLFQNMERLGFSNVVITNNSPNDLAKVFSNTFDVIVLDAPCSGEGMMRKEEAARENWTLENVKLCQKRDIEIINEANKMLKKGGKLIYSTCTFSPEEDCQMVEYIISLGYKLLPIKETLKKCATEGFIKNTLRVYPMDKGEGQFMALLEKESDASGSIKLAKKVIDKDINIVKKFLETYTTLDINTQDIVKIGSRYYLSKLNFDYTKLNVKNLGVELGEVIKNRFEPYHDLFKALGHFFKNQIRLSVCDKLVDHYLHGEEINYPVPDGFGVIIVDDLVLGGFKASFGHIKNHYPKGLRHLKLYYED